MVSWAFILHIRCFFEVIYLDGVLANACVAPGDDDNLSRQVGHIPLGVEL